MRILQRLALPLTIVNLALTGVLISINLTAYASANSEILRGSGLEIVDKTGRVRASISVEPETTMNSQTYPETVVLRLSDQKSRPMVKITASEEGSAIGLSDDTPKGGIQQFATRKGGNFVRVTAPDGKEQLIKP